MITPRMVRTQGAKTPSKRPNRPDGLDASFGENADRRLKGDLQHKLFEREKVDSRSQFPAVANELQPDGFD